MTAEHEPSMFESSVAALRAGSRDVADLARLVADELTDSELLGLLDGDSSFLSGLRDFGRHGYNHAPIVAGAVERLGLPGVRFTDGPRGIVMGHSTCFPVAMARGATWDRRLEQEIGEAIGVEGRAQGANLFAGVCVNLLRHPAWGRAQETYGEDPVHLGEMGAALTRGVRQHLMACVKHFAANSIENARFKVDVHVDDDVLHEVYLPHFRTVVDAGADAVMSAYNRLNGRWCGDDPVLLTEILRDEWGFEGFTISDFLFGLRDPVGSVVAGLDVEMPFRQQRDAALPGALADGSLQRSIAMKSARRLIAAQLQWAASTSKETPPLDTVASDSHRALARRAAAQSMVLLRNESVDGRPVLPIERDEVRHLAVIGALADADNLGDEGSSSVQPPHTVKLLDGVRTAFPDGVVAFDSGADLTAAATAARAADVAVVIVGYTADDEGESLASMDTATLQLMPRPMGSKRLAGGASKAISLATRIRSTSAGDREQLTLKPDDEALIEAVAAVNPRTVVVLVAGSAVLTERWRNKVASIVVAWYPGMEGGNGLADVLTGAVEPGGRLPFAVPTDDAHLPHFDSDADSITYDRWWGQRRFDRDGRVVAYPFGFGLGYTTFAVTDLEIEEIDTAALTATVVATCRNTGDRTGSTVVQISASGDSGPGRPRRQLVGFERVSVDPGEAVSVSVDLTLRPLARRNAATHEWAIVPAVYTIEAGQFSGDPAAATAPLAL